MIKNIKEEILYRGWKTLKSISFDYMTAKGIWKPDKKEVYVRGDAATILLYNLEKKTVILTKQFRMPTYLNGNLTGILIETCAGMLDGRTPEVCIIKEAHEETGIEIKHVNKIFDAYTSPGAITEIMHFFTGEYSDSLKTSSGGGLEEENEKIEVIELAFDELVDMVYKNQIKDVKTITLILHLKIQGIL